MTSLHDTDGRPLAKLPDCPKCGEDEVGARYDSVWCHLCGWRGSLTWLCAEALVRMGAYR